jgi:chromosome segregation ATPase
MLKFIGKFFGKKVDDAMEDFTGMLVSIDPETASDAQLEMLHDKFKELSTKVATARVSRDKEVQEADAIKAVYEQRKAAARIMLDKIKVTENETEKSVLETSLNNFMTQIEEMKEDVQREVQEAEEAEQLFKDLSQYIQDYLSVMDKTKKAMERAKKDMIKSELDVERANMKAEAAEIKAGLTSDNSGINVAMNAFNKKVQSSKVKAEASNLRANLLTKTDIEKSDKNIENALREASGKVQNTDIASRFANL